MKTRTSTYRLEYLDWLRGLGAIIMLQGHVFDSFTKPELRPGGAWVLSQFAGGMPPAIFLFLTGVTLAFLMDSSERKGLVGGARVFAAFRRSGYLFFLAFAFRAQMFLSGWPTAWTDLLKVDILNCMGFSIAVLSVMALFRTRQRVVAAAAVGLAIALAAPLVSAADWTRVPPAVANYFAPSRVAFGFFPWAAYLAFGVSAGSLIRSTTPEATDGAMRWIAAGGGLTIVVAQACAASSHSIYKAADFWLNSPAQVLTKLGATLVMLSAAYLWTRYGARHGAWSWVRQFGVTSLLVYWVHIELVYGRWFWFLKNGLTVAQTAAAAIGVILLMLAISALRTNWARIRSALAETGWWYAPTPERVPGD
ncbi:MAG: acyltransferase family protein [Bryobacteraceae bacterium]